jgi:hypothetical protein
MELEKESPPSWMVREKALDKGNFHQQAETWKGESAYLSAIPDITGLPSFRAIVGMGPKVVPLLLARLEHDPYYWFVALQQITNEDPVPPADRGDMARMIQAWLQWGRQHGHRW